MSRKATTIAVLVLLTAPLGVVVAPTDVPAQSRKDIERAKKAFRDGKKAYDKERYDEAAAQFLEAYELSGRNELLYNIGQAYRLGGQLLEAEKYLQLYLEKEPDAPNSEDVVQAVVEVQQQIAASLATVQVETTVAGRQVFVDSETDARCVTPCAVTVEPGVRRIVIRGDGVKEKVETVTLEPGKTLKLDTSLAPSVIPGYLMLTTDRPGGRLVVGSEVDTSLPLQQPLELAPGDYPVRVESAHRAKWEGQLTIEPERTTEVLVPMQSLVEASKRGSWPKGLAYGLWGVSVAAGGAGLLLGNQAKTAFDSLQTANSSGQAGSADLVQQGRDTQKWANVMFATAAGALVTGTVLFVVDAMMGGKEPSPERPRPTAQLTE